MHPYDVAATHLGDCDDVLRAQAGMALSLGLPVAALVWDFGGSGHVSLIVGDHSYADAPVWVIDSTLPGPTSLYQFKAGGRLSAVADFKVVS